MLARSPVEELQEQRLEVDFKVALCALTIVRCALNILIAWFPGHNA